MPVYAERVTKEAVKKVFSDFTAYKLMGIYNLAASLAGSIIEAFLPGDSGARALLPLHSQVVTSASRAAAVPTLDTEESTNNYRLSLLLAMIASRTC